MADVHNYRRGETNDVVCRVETVQAVSLGDMVGLSSSSVIRAGDEAWSNLSQAQYDFAQKFAGVAAQRKVANTSSPGTGGGPANHMRVASEGVFEFDVATTTAAYEVGQLVTPAKASGNTLENQKVEKSTDLARAIGKVEERVTNASTFGNKVKVRIFSRQMLPGVLSSGA